MVHSRNERTKNQLEFWQRLKISEFGFRIVLLAIIVAGGLMYIILTNSVATQGLAIKGLSDRLEELSLSRSVLQAQGDKLQSMQRLDTIAKELDFVRVSNVEYLTSSSGTVATR